MVFHENDVSSLFLILSNHFLSDNALVGIVGKIIKISEPKVVPRELRLICQNAAAHPSRKDEIFFQKVAKVQHLESVLTQNVSSCV